MELSRILTVERVRVPLKARTKIEAITELVDVLADTGGLSDRGKALEAVLKRESERTTGLGYGMAIPHGKSDGCKQLAIAVGKPAEPIEFQSYDGRPVIFIVLLISPPDQTGLHIRTLGRISRVMNNDKFREAVATVMSPEELYAAIKAHEPADEGDA